MVGIRLGDYFLEYQKWQEKVLSIGQERIKKAEGEGKNPIIEGVNHLQQEYTEVQRSLLRYTMKNSDENKYAFVAETGDIVNVAGIVVAMMEARSPLEIMLLKLDLKGIKYGTRPCSTYQPSQQYTEKELFDFWVQEIDGIGKQLREEGEGKKELERRYNRLSKEYLGLLEDIDHFSNDTTGAYKSEILESLGDFLNIGAIMMSIVGERVPFDRLTQKLFEKDGKFGTGPMN